MSTDSGLNITRMYFDDNNGSDFQFQLGFLVQNARTGEPLDDVRHVEWYAAIYQSDGITERLV